MTDNRAGKPENGTERTIHAGCILIGETGILIRGATGAGKSTLARDLLTKAQMRGLFARLVSDDRTQLQATHGRLIACPVASIAGFIEIRGIGIMPMPHEPATIVRLIVDLAAADAVPRMPEADDTRVRLCGVVIPRLIVPERGNGAEIVLERIVRPEAFPFE